jgi:serine/threonine protein kinase KIN1/2
MAMEDNESAARAEQSGKKRSTLHTRTGKWSLGKTIGTGGVSKVKAAKNLETGEQVL